MTKKAVVLVSGGLDSATILAMARTEGYDCYTLSFDYGQRHRCELLASDAVSEHSGAVEHRTVQLDLRQFGGSALTDDAIDVPDGGGEGIPVVGALGLDRIDEGKRFRMVKTRRFGSDVMIEGLFENQS